MADLSNTQRSSVTRITGKDELFNVDVIKGIDGIDRMSVDASTAPRSVQGLFVSLFENNGSSSLNINGSGTPIVFEIPLAPQDRVVSSFSFFGRDSGIKFSQFLAQNQTLQNGVLV